MANAFTDLTATAAVTPSLPLTDWARKYGRYSLTDHKSGLTPTEYAFARLVGSKPHVGVYEDHQKWKLKGFTTQELALLDCLPLRELVASDLPTFILPMLRIDHWETTPAEDFLRGNLYPLANGQGMWVASNPIVWFILQPILSLATKMLTSIYVLPWFDALLKAPREPIPPSRMRPQDQGRDDLYFFRPLPADQWTPQSVTERDRIFDLLSNQYKYTFGFMSPQEDPFDPATDKAPGSIGITTTNYEYMQFDPAIDKIPKVFTFLDLSQLEHLLRGDLNSAEKMCIEWQMANTIAHEVMHAIDYIRTSLQGKYDECELYFDTEAIPELGYSFEQAINLGSTEAYLASDTLYTPPVDIPPLGFFLCRQYPTADDILSMAPRGVMLQDPGVNMVQEFFPIPIAFYEDMQQEAFWSGAVRSFGHGLLHYRSKREGSRIQLSIRPNRIKRSTPQRFAVRNHTYPDLNNQFIASVTALHEALTLTSDERKAMEFGRNLLITSRSDQAYWNESVSQQGHAEAAMRIIASARRQQFPQVTQPQTLLSLIQCMVEAIDNHQVQIAAIQNIKAATQVSYLDRRSALKVWNRGTRVFLNDLKDFDQGNDIDTIPLLLDLEVAHMVLYDPADPLLQTSEEFVEIQSIKLARAEFTDGNYTNCRNDLYEDWDQRKSDLDIAKKMLIYCMDAAPATWIPLWKSLKTDLMDEVNDLQKPLRPNA